MKKKKRILPSASTMYSLMHQPSAIVALLLLATTPNAQAFGVSVSPAHATRKAATAITKNPTVHDRTLQSATNPNDNRSNNNNNWQDLAAQWASMNREEGEKGVASATKATTATTTVKESPQRTPPSHTNPFDLFQTRQMQSSSTSSSPTTTTNSHPATQSQPQPGKSISSLAQEWAAMNRGDQRNGKAAAPQQPPMQTAGPRGGERTATRLSDNTGNFRPVEAERQAQEYEHVTRQNMNVMGPPPYAPPLNNNNNNGAASSQGPTMSKRNDSSSKPPVRNNNNAYVPDLAAEWANMNRVHDEPRSQKDGSKRKNQNGPAATTESTEPKQQPESPIQGGGNMFLSQIPMTPTPSSTTLSASSTVAKASTTTTTNTPQNTAVGGGTQPTSTSTSPSNNNAHISRDSSWSPPASHDWASEWANRNREDSPNDEEAKSISSSKRPAAPPIKPRTSHQQSRLEHNEEAVFVGDKPKPANSFGSMSQPVSPSSANRNKEAAPSTSYPAVSAATLAQEWTSMNQERDFYVNGRNNEAKPHPTTNHLGKGIDAPKETSPPSDTSPRDSSNQNRKETDAKENNPYVPDLAKEWAAMNMDRKGNNRNLQDRQPRTSYFSTSIPAAAQPKMPVPANKAEAAANSAQFVPPKLGDLAKEWAALNNDRSAPSQDPPVVEAQPKTSRRQHASNDELMGNIKTPLNIATPNEHAVQHVVQRPPYSSSEETENTEVRDPDSVVEKKDSRNRKTTEVVKKEKGSVSILNEKPATVSRKDPVDEQMQQLEEKLLRLHELEEEIKQITAMTERAALAEEEEEENIEPETEEEEEISSKSVDSSPVQLFLDERPPSIYSSSSPSSPVSEKEKTQQSENEKTKSNFKVSGKDFGNNDLVSFLDERPPSVYSAVPPKPKPSTNDKNKKKEKVVRETLSANPLTSPSQRLYIDPRQKTNIRVNPEKYVDKTIGEKLSPPPAWRTPEEEIKEKIVDAPITMNALPTPGHFSGRQSKMQPYNATLAISIDKNPDKLTDQETARVVEDIRATFSQGNIEHDDPPYRQIKNVEYIGILDVATGRRLGFWVSWLAFEETKLESFMDRLNARLVEAGLKNRPESQIPALGSPSSTEDRKEPIKVPEDWLSARVANEEAPHYPGNTIDLSGSPEAAGSDWLAARVAKEEAPRLESTRNAPNAAGGGGGGGDWLAARVANEESKLPSAIASIDTQNTNAGDFSEDLYKVEAEDNKIPPAQAFVRMNSKEEAAAAARHAQLRAETLEAQTTADKKQEEEARIAEEKEQSRLKAEEEWEAEEQRQAQMNAYSGEATIDSAPESSRIKDEQYAASVMAIEEARMKAEEEAWASLKDKSNAAELKAIEEAKRFAAAEERARLEREEQDSSAAKAASERFEKEEAEERARLLGAEVEAASKAAEAALRANEAEERFQSIKEKHEVEQGESETSMRQPKPRDISEAEERFRSEKARRKEERASRKAALDVVREAAQDVFETKASRELKLVESNAEATIEAAKFDAAKANLEVQKLEEEAKEARARMEFAASKAAENARQQAASEEEAKKKAWEEEKARLKAEAQENFRARAESGLDSRQKSFFSLNNPVARKRFNATLALTVETDPHSLTPQDTATIAETIKATFSQGSPDKSDPPFRQVTDVSYIGVFDVGASERLGYWISWTAFEETSLDSFMDRLNAKLDDAPLSQPVTKNAKKRGQGMKSLESPHLRAETGQQIDRKEQHRLEDEYARLEKALIEAKEKANKASFAVEEAEQRAKTEVEAAATREARIKAHAESKTRRIQPSNNDMQNSGHSKDESGNKENNKIDGENVQLRAAEEKRPPESILNKRTQDGRTSRKRPRRLEPEVISYDEKDSPPPVLLPEFRKGEIERQVFEPVPFEKEPITISEALKQEFESHQDPPDREDEEVVERRAQQHALQLEREAVKRDATSVPKEKAAEEERAQNEAIRLEQEAKARDEELAEFLLNKQEYEEDRAQKEAIQLEKEALERDDESKAFSQDMEAAERRSQEAAVRLEKGIDSGGEEMPSLDSFAKDKEEDEARARRRALMLEQEAEQAERERLEFEAKQKEEEERAAAAEALRLETEARIAEQARARSEAEKQAAEERKAVEDALRLESEARRKGDARLRAAAEKEAENERRARKEALRQAKLAELSQQRARLERNKEEKDSRPSKQAEEQARARQGWLGKSPDSDDGSGELLKPKPYLQQTDPLPEVTMPETRTSGSLASFLPDLPIIPAEPVSKSEPPKNQPKAEKAQSKTSFQPTIKREPLSKPNSMPKNTQPLLQTNEEIQVTKPKAFVRASPDAVQRAAVARGSLKEFNATLALSVDTFSNFMTPKDTAVVAEAIASSFGQGSKSSSDPDFRQVNDVEYVGTYDVDDFAGQQLQYRISWTAFGDTSLDSFMERLNGELARALSDDEAKEEKLKPSREEQQLKAEAKKKAKATIEERRITAEKVLEAEVMSKKQEKESRQRSLLSTRLRWETVRKARKVERDAAKLKAKLKKVSDRKRADKKKEKLSNEPRIDDWGGLDDFFAMSDISSFFGKSKTPTRKNKD